MIRNAMKNRVGRAFAQRFSILSMSILCGIAFAKDLPPVSKHVVLIVWDGMRPDLVSETDSPTLWKLARAGVVFRNHHSVYPSATNVNGAALVSGEMRSPEALSSVVSLLGPFPGFSFAQKDSWTTKALKDIFCKNAVP